MVDFARFNHSSDKVERQDDRHVYTGSIKSKIRRRIMHASVGRWRVEYTNVSVLSKLMSYSVAFSPLRWMLKPAALIVPRVLYPPTRMVMLPPWVRGRRRVSECASGTREQEYSVIRLMGWLWIRNKQPPSSQRPRKTRRQRRRGTLACSVLVLTCWGVTDARARQGGGCHTVRAEKSKHAFSLTKRSAAPHRLANG